jgi:alpha-beta hydrolase superfamily lysophospholipase
MSTHPIRARILAFLTAAAAVLAGGLLFAGTAHATPPAGDNCRQHTVSVTLNSAQPATRYRLVGWLCGRDTPDATVQVLLSGLTYDHRYWDLPYQGSSDYSYVHTAVANGDLVFNVDRLGTGESDHPAGDQVTIPAEADVAHQLVTVLRNGSLDGIHHRRVVGVGHSMGAAMWMVEAASWHDVDALVLADYLHQINPAQSATVTAEMTPAGAGMPAGYYTIPGPAARATAFYQTSDAAPAVIATDARYASTATSGELAGKALARDPQISSAITVPVLEAVGQDDSLACNPAIGMSCHTAKDVCAREAPFFGHHTRLSALVVDAAGHSINLHYHANAWYTAANQWINHTLASSASGAGGQASPFGTIDSAPYGINGDTCTT